MNLEEFSEIAKADIDRFVANWRKGVKKEPDMWPLDLPEGEWFEQFLAFTTGTHP